MKRIYVTFALDGRLRGQIVEGKITRMENLSNWARCKIAAKLGCAVRAVNVQTIIPLHQQTEVAA